MLRAQFRDERELGDAMAEALLLCQEATARRPGEPWAEWLARRARQRGRILLSRRDGARLVVNASPGPGSRHLLDADLAVLVDCGFTPAQALRGVMAVCHYVNGFAMKEQAEVRRQTDDPSYAEDPPPGQLLDLFTATPILAAAICQVGDPRGPEEFDYGLKLLLDGMAAALERAEPAYSFPAPV